MTVCEKYRGILAILIELQKQTTLKIPDINFGLCKDRLKLSNILLLNRQFYNPYQHSLKINNYGVPVIEAKQGGGTAHRLKIALVNSEFDIVR